MTNLAAPAREIFYAALAAADPFKAVRPELEQVRTFFRIGDFARLFVIGFGKASGRMAEASEQFLGDLIDTGIIITKYGHTSASGRLAKITGYEAAHPVPDENGVATTRRIVDLLKGADERTLILCLISGGGSALLVEPYEGISLREKQEVTNLLLKSGVTINELNTVRKHLSMVKGGRLAGIAYPASIISLIVSDVVGDSLDVIASGPTAPDSSTYSDALAVLGKCQLTDQMPAKALSILERGARGEIPETPKEGDDIFTAVQNIVVASNRGALLAAKRKAEELGFQTSIISSTLQGEACNAARSLAHRARTAKLNRPFCLLSGGETTVTVRGSGLGGRNTELALAFALEIEGEPRVTLLSAGTDGTDGPTDAAGAIVDGHTIGRARTINLDAKAYLDGNDSYSFFHKTGELLITGPTGTNVMDIQIILAE
ncbi:MAG TPA: glycerate kinase [Syntrophorhabdales bacterium]|nr:glycerate kinase [Syntrophorhabdales bacterium]